uniref:Ectonucleoside triphosphate diphosphohydrolase 2 n=1 Tax=Callorhinchus milii TaxID=7868 RepID=A0A4W3IUX0_CALMI
LYRPYLHCKVWVCVVFFILHGYGIVIDAGSSRSTLFVYKWPSSRENNTGIVSQHSSCRVKGSGISGYANNPGNAGRSLKTCLEQALHDIPESSHKQTPLYLGATAGMRLPRLNVLTAVADTMRSYRFDFRGAKVLTGQEEGLFGWVTVNYLQENFIKYNWIGQWIKPRKRTVGAMDFGGASTQLTFETTKSMENPNSLMVLKLYEHEYKVYTHSYLCYGRDQVMKKCLASLYKSSTGDNLRISVMNPCMPTGYQTNRTLGFIYNSPCIKEERPTNISDSSIVTFIGSSNPTKCKNYLQEIFDFQSCNFSKCSFNGIYQPRLTGDFMAFSAFYYTINFLKTTLKKDITTPHELEEAAKSICGDSIEQLREKAPTVKIERLVDYCTTSLYIHILTIEGYKFNNETFKNISFQLKVLFYTDLSTPSAQRDPACSMPLRPACPTIGGWTFSLSVPALWNSIPLSLHFALSVAFFKACLKTLLFNCAFGHPPTPTLPDLHPS